MLFCNVGRQLDHYRTSSTITGLALLTSIAAVALLDEARREPWVRLVRGTIGRVASAFSLVASGDS